MGSERHRESEMTALFEWRRAWPLLVVVSLHVAFLYALQAGLMHRVALAPVVREVIATLIRPEPPKPPPPPKMEPQKPPAAKPIAKPLPPPNPYVAPVITMPSETAITLPPPPEPVPVPFEPAAPLIAPPAPPAPAAPEPMPVLPPRFDAAYLNNPPPTYPAVAKRKGDEGKVMLRVRVDAQGRAEDVQVKTSSGSFRLDDAALATVREWRFVPARQGDRAVAAWVLVPIVFKLER